MEPTQEEIWDDSALVDSWNQALEEYKKYHSIHAKGGSVEDVAADLQALRARWNAKPETDNASEPMEESSDAPPPDTHDGDDVSVPKSDETPAQAFAQGVAAQASCGFNNQFEPSNYSHTKDHQQGQQSDHRAAAFGPQTLLGTVQDDGLQKLLMSWYYAGYYTGLYERKQQTKPAEG
ncbi:hypothetical protein B0H66DRAFT_341083 [Apodospora peruviana]|uniref:Survival Motor Neuron Gemin2-binding domain-containing protein n=1 Tax=Apodospora peruviana TaxID=516989 RepID=A0AAE0HYT7_9PEZI|nr:hypothetical protein B0H66DRAFT_341083 [Apodospora peruviana]